MKDTLEELICPTKHTQDTHFHRGPFPADGFPPPFSQVINWPRVYDSPTLYPVKLKQKKKKTGLSKDYSSTLTTE